VIEDLMFGPKAVEGEGVEGNPFLTRSQKLEPALKNFYLARIVQFSS
jgi:hypothetical protein